MGDIPIAVDLDVYHATAVNDPDDFESETTSIGSRIYKGLFENGRRYQATKENDYWCPSDEQQFETFETCHMLCLVLDYHERNLLHRAPIGDKPQHILDIGTGKGNWAIDAADMYPDAIIRGVDLFPPPVTWMPPNCIFEVDDVQRQWTWKDPFDFIHLRQLLGAFSNEGWESLYRQCYSHLKPGGWIEQMEFDVRVQTDDNTLKKDSLLAGWGNNFIGCGERAGHPLTTQATMRGAMENAGFVDVHEKLYKVPVGGWARDPVLKEAGHLNYVHWKAGLEGYALWLLTKFGAPKPWSKEEVLVYVAKIRAELKNPQQHIFGFARRVWARKPLDSTEDVEIKLETS